MERVTFYSYVPYLSVPIHKDRGMSVTFSKDCTYVPSNPIELQLLREYAERTRSSYTIVEAGGELGLEDLIRLHEKWEDSLITDLEQRQAEKEQAELKRKEDHDLYSMLRGSDQVYR